VRDDLIRAVECQLRLTRRTRCHGHPLSESFGKVRDDIGPGSPPKDGGQLAWMLMVLSSIFLVQQRLWCQCDESVRGLKFFLE
jgi:hypothetical protein